MNLLSNLLTHIYYQRAILKKTFMQCQQASSSNRRKATLSQSLFVKKKTSPVANYIRCSTNYYGLSVLNLNYSHTTEVFGILSSL